MGSPGPYGPGLLPLRPSLNGVDYAGLAGLAVSGLMYFLLSPPRCELGVQPR
jgi:hypothetical protein